DFDQIVDVGRERPASGQSVLFYTHSDLLAAPEHLLFFLALHFLPERGRGRRRQDHSEHHHGHQADQRVSFLNSFSLNSFSLNSFSLNSFSLNSFSLISSFISVTLIFIYVHTDDLTEESLGAKVENFPDR